MGKGEPEEGPAGLGDGAYEECDLVVSKPPVPLADGDFSGAQDQEELDRIAAETVTYCNLQTPPEESDG